MKLNKIDKRVQLLLLQVICHIALVAALFSFTLTDWLASLCIYFITGCLGVTVLLHRHYSHRSFAFKNNTVKKFFVVCSVWGIIGDPISWVNTHRHHHKATDKPGDPHSPHVHGFFNVQWLSMFYTPTTLRAVPDLIRDRFLVSLHKHYFKIHWTLMIVLSLASLKMAMVLYMVPAAILWNAGSLINTAGHMFGYRNHQTNDTSANNTALGLFVWGEGWHNNHHNSPAKAIFGEKWWEIDIGGWVVHTVAQKDTIR